MVSGVPGISLHSAVGVESLVLPGPHLLCACNARINAACGGGGAGEAREGSGAVGSMGAELLRHSSTDF